MEDHICRENGIVNILQHVFKGCINISLQQSLIPRSLKRNSNVEDSDIYSGVVRLPDVGTEQTKYREDEDQL